MSELFGNTPPMCYVLIFVMFVGIMLLIRPPKQVHQDNPDEILGKTVRKLWGLLNK